MYNEYQNMLDRNSKVLSNQEEKEENLIIYDNKYDEDSNGFQCIIDECPELGKNVIGISTNSEEDYLPYIVCDKHYHKLMTRYYKNNKNNKISLLSIKHSKYKNNFGVKIRS